MLWVCVFFYEDFGFFFLGIGYEMGSLSMTEKGFGYEMCNECVMKFILFEGIGICTLCSLTR